MVKSILPITLSLLAGLLLLLSCGKEAKTSSPRTDQTSNPITPDALERLLNQQEISCSAGQSCPDYLAKLVVVDKGRVKYCTGFLVNGDTVATTSSCLTDQTRQINGDCSQDIFLFFMGKGSSRKPIRVGCQKVLLYSNIDPNGDVEIWRDNVAFLQIDKRMSDRKHLSFSRDGIGDHKMFTTWVMDQMDAATAIIRQDDCEAVHNTFINPLVKNESSPSMTYAGCAANNGNVGAPLIDGRGKVRAMISKAINPGFKTHPLLIKPLQEMLHATSFSCAPTIFDSEVQDEKECSKVLDLTILDRLRGEMLSPERLFGELSKKLEDSVSLLSPYLKFGVKFHQTGDIREAEVYPKCFKPFGEWLESFRGFKGNYIFQ